jgi:hypothetical protein
MDEQISAIRSPSGEILKCLKIAPRPTSNNLPQRWLSRIRRISRDDPWCMRARSGNSWNGADLIGVYIENIGGQYVNLSSRANSARAPRSDSGAPGLCSKDCPPRLLRPWLQVPLLSSLAISEPGG